MAASGQKADRHDADQAQKCGGWLRYHDRRTRAMAVRLASPVPSNAKFVSLARSAMVG
jgi:hypothetical protein